MGSHGPDIHNMISPEELAYMRAHPEQFKNYRGNYDYIGGITGNAPGYIWTMDLHCIHMI